MLPEEMERNFIDSFNESTIKSMGQLLARVWMLHIRNLELGINHHRLIVVPRRIWQGIEGQEVVADIDKKIGSAHAFPISLITTF